MTTAASVLVVAATNRELASGPWRRLRCGVGPVDAAAAIAAELARAAPAAILQVGIAGARRGSGLTPGTLVIGSEARYCDLGSEDWAPAVVPGSDLLMSAAMRALPAAMVLTIGMSARVGGTSATAGVAVEAMEGFAVLRAAQLAGIPALEVRAISNEIEEADRARWHFDTALAAITAATPLLVAEFERALRTGNA